MNCQQIEPMLLNYLEGALDPVLAGMVKVHVDSCASCRKAFDIIVKAESHIQQEKALRVNPFLFTRIQARLNEEPKPVPGILQPVILRRPLYYVTVVLVAVSIGILAGRQLSNLITFAPASGTSVSESDEWKQEFYLQNLEKEDISQLMNN